MPTSGSAGLPSSPPRSQRTPKRRDESLYHRAVVGWLRVSQKHPVAVLCALAVLSALALPLAGSLRIDTDLKKLLPRTSKTVQQMDIAIAKVGDLGYFSIVVESSDTDESIRFVKEMAQRLESSEYVRTVIYKNPVDFLKTNRFLLMNVEQLDELHAYILQQRRARSPFNLGLDDDPAPETPEPTPDPGLEKIKRDYASLEKMTRYHLSDDGRTLAMQIRPKNAVTNLGFVRRMYAFLAEDALALKASGGYPDDMTVEVSGSLRNKLDEYGIVVDDIKRSTVLSGLLVIVVLLAFFRNPVSVVVLLIPLAAGLTWTFALAYAALGFLNTISAMLFVVLFGLGIDHGIHLLKRFLQHGEGSISEALDATFTETGRAVWVSALTTAGGFAVMLLNDFKGFTHLGFIAASSMILITLAYFMGLPALIILAVKWGLLKRAPEGQVTQHRMWMWSALGRLSERIPTRVGNAIGIFIIVAGLASASQLRFNFDFDTLKGTNAASEKVKAKQAKVYKESLTPGAILFAPDDSIQDELLLALEARKLADTDQPTIGRILSMRDFLPNDQEARLEKIRESARLITPLLLRKVKDRQLRKMLRSLRDSTNLEFITFEDVPAQIKSFFKPQDGSDDRMIFIFPSIERRHGRMAMAFADDMFPVRAGGRDYIPTGDALIFAELLRAVKTQGLVIFGLSLLGIAGLLALQFRSRRATFATLLGLVGGLSLMTGVIFVFGVDINFYNMVIFAAVVGMGIDSIIHLYSRWETSRNSGEATTPSGSHAGAALTRLGAPITAAMLTTAAGYVGMISSAHPGLRSIGILAVVGLGSCFLVAVTIFPVYLRSQEHPTTGSKPS